VEAPARRDGAPSSRAGNRVVAVVDDDLYVLRALGRALSSNGYSTLLFDNPWTALSGIPAASVDLVITDRHMPHCSGPDLARRLRDSWGDGGPPLVLLSADLLDLEDAERTLFDLVLAKPIGSDDLMFAIGAFAHRRPRSGTMRRSRAEDGETEPG
jgi:DNA-binding response OmpR family regulator